MPNSSVQLSWTDECLQYLWSFVGQLGDVFPNTRNFPDTETPPTRPNEERAEQQTKNASEDEASSETKGRRQKWSVRDGERQTHRQKRIVSFGVPERRHAPTISILFTLRTWTHTVNDLSYSDIWVSPKCEMLFLCFLVLETEFGASLVVRPRWALQVTSLGHL